jgi:sec-independent protein translocase protein TatA
MFRSFGTPELIIILVVVLLLFGVGRIGKVAGELGKWIREFRNGLKGEKDDEPGTQEKETKEDTKKEKE